MRLKKKNLNRTQSSGSQGLGEEVNRQRDEGILGVMDLSCILIVVEVTWWCAFVKMKTWATEQCITSLYINYTSIILWNLKGWFQILKGRQMANDSPNISEEE